MKRRTFIQSTAGAAASGVIVGNSAGREAAALPESPSASPSPWPSVPMPKFEIADGRFEPNWDSLRKYYTCPDWFRDAKLGFWAHWGPQSEAEAGDWYTRSMYLQGHAQYDHHLENYGHPTKHGAKDLMCQWKAEHFDPEDLINLYKKAGGKYFAFMVNHHDNFDSWDSRYQPWNSVNIGPKKDLCRMWADATRKHGLRFGVTVHNTPYRCWNTFMPAWYGSDRKGPLAGVPYDGAVVGKADGKGTPWEGLDPRDLYGPVHEANSPCPEFVRQFLLRVDDLLQKYQPDLLYFDDAVHHLLDKNDRIRLRAVLGMPDLITQIGAHYYNSNLKWNQGSLEAVLNIKHVAATPLLEEMLTSAVVNDFEVKDPDKPFDYPWQTDISLGSWHYRRNDHYRSPTQLIHRLISIVANNGNMLLGVAQKGDGTIDAKQRKIVEEIGAWMRINGEAIHATRPWAKSREGSIRFTRSKTGDRLYAISTVWPADGKLLVGSLVKGAIDVIDVRLIGHAGRLRWHHTDQGVSIELPDTKPCSHAWAFAIRGAGEHPFATS